MYCGLETAAMRAGLGTDTLRKIIRETALCCSENWGPGRGLGYQFTDRDIEALLVYKALRRLGWDRQDAAAGGEAFRQRMTPLDELRIIAVGDEFHARYTAEALPDFVFEAPEVRVANLAPIFKSGRAA